MTAPSLPPLPGCGRPAAACFTLSRTDPPAVVAEVWLCSQHAYRDAIGEATGLTLHSATRPPGETHPCGEGWDHLAQRPIHAPAAPPYTGPLRHPAWCSPAACQVVGDLLPLTGTAHKSRPVEIDLGPFVPAAHRRITVHLSQSVAPWPVDVFLIAGSAAGEVGSWRLEDAREKLATLGALVDRAYPVIGDTWPAQIATGHGSPASAEDDACRVHGEPICVDWLGESDDQDNVWTCRESGVQWRTKARRPGNGSEFVKVVEAGEDTFELLCFACAGRRWPEGRWLGEHYPNEADATAAAQVHAAGHETAADGGS